MATREASIRLMLKSGAFQAEMRKLRRQVATHGRYMGASLRAPISKGLEAAKASMVGFGSTIKGHIKTAATLGGALSLGAAVKSAIELEGHYVRLAASMSSFGDRAIEAEDVQKKIESAAFKTKSAFVDLVPLANQFATLSPDALEEGLTRAVLQGKRLGVSAEIVARTYTRLVAKGVAGSVREAEKLTEQMNEFGRTVLGIDPDEAIDPMDVAEYASFVRGANSDITSMNALLSKTGSTAKDLGQAIEIVEELGLVLQTGKGLKELRKETRLGVKDINLQKDAIENLLITLEKGGPKAFRKLQEQFGTDRARKAIQEIIGEDIIVKAETGKVTRKEWELRVGQLRSELKNAQTAVFDWGRINQANADITKTTGADLQSALNEITKAFSRPEMIDSLNRLAKVLPEFAKGVVKIIDFVTKHPLLAAGGAIGIKAGGAFLGGMLPGLLGMGATGLKGGAVGLGAKIATLGRTAPMVSGAAGGLAAGGLTLAAVTGAAAVGGAIGYGGYKMALEPAIEDDIGKLRSIDETLMSVDTVLRTKGIAETRKALGTVRAQLKEAKEGPGFFISTLAAGAKLFGADIKSAEMTLAEKTLKLTEAESQLERQVKMLEKQMQSATRGVGDFVNALSPPGTPPTTRGPTQPTNSKPGAAPRERPGE